MLTVLALRKDAPAAWRDKIARFIDEGVKLPEPLASAWRRIKFRTLVAFDDATALERNLRAWIQVDEAPKPWQTSLAKLLAEQGKIDDAIQLMESAEKSAGLSNTDYLALSRWYLVRNKRAEYKRAQVASFMAMPEYQLQSWISRRRGRWNQSTLPTKLNEQVLFAFEALFRKSNTPGSYIYNLRQYYEACRDYRLLRMVPAAMLGRTPQQVYGFLGNIDRQLMAVINNEATADEIVDAIRQARETASSAIDLRALDLLELVIERRSAKVLNQPGPHAQRAVAALNRACNREWQNGEIRQMASLLHGLGQITNSKIAAERIKRLRQLQQLAAKWDLSQVSDSRKQSLATDRLYLNWYLASAIFQFDDRRRGIDILEAAVNGFDSATNRRWTRGTHQPLLGLIGFYESVGRYRDAEQRLDRQLSGVSDLWLRNVWHNRRTQVWLNALRTDATVSLGRTTELYRKLNSRLRAELIEFTDDAQRRQGVRDLMTLYRIAAEKKWDKQYLTDLRQFAFKELSQILAKQTNNYQSLMNMVGEQVRTKLGNLMPWSSISISLTSILVGSTTRGSLAGVSLAPSWGICLKNNSLTLPLGTTFAEGDAEMVTT